jgi:hypothetical protein
VLGAGTSQCSTRAVNHPRGRHDAPNDGRRGSCMVARVAEQGERAAGYRGTVALNVLMPNPSLEVVLGPGLTRTQSFRCRSRRG